MPIRMDITPQAKMQWHLVTALIIERLFYAGFTKDETKVKPSSNFRDGADVKSLGDNHQQFTNFHNIRLDIIIELPKIESQLNIPFDHDAL